MVMLFISQGCQCRHWYRHWTLQSINCWGVGKDPSAAQPSTHHPLVSTAPGNCSLSLSIVWGQIRAGNGVRGAVLLQGPNWDVEAKSAGSCHFYRQNQLGREHRDLHLTQEWALWSQLAFCLYCTVLLSAVCSGGSSCAGRNCASGHKNVSLDPWSYSSALLSLHICRYFRGVKCRVRIFLDPFLELIHMWRGKGQSQEGCGCSLVVSWPHHLFYY